MRGACLSGQVKDEEFLGWGRGRRPQIWEHMQRFCGRREGGMPVALEELN